MASALSFRLSSTVSVGALMACGLATWRAAAAPLVFTAGKPTLCTITLNSTDERDIAKAALLPEGFQHLELADASRPQSWLEDACTASRERGLRCDVLIVSGHFGGDLFFGVNRLSGMRLFVRDLERHACAETCAGVLSAPQRKFLFGCNTLATKDADQRTPAAYLDALLHAGIGRADAERIVAGRYGPVGQSFKDQMRRIFSGRGLILGFDSKAPAGSVVRNSFKSYFARVRQRYGSYSRYLAEDRQKSLTRDDAFSSAMEKFADAQAVGLLPSDTTNVRRKENICRLGSDAVWYSDRLDLIATLVRDVDFFAYIPAIEAFLRMWPPRRPAAATGLLDYDDPRESAALARLRAAPQPASFRSVLNAQSPSYYKVQLANMGATIGWLSEAELVKIAEETLAPYFKKKNTMQSDTADLICQMGWRIAGKLRFKKADISASLRSQREMKRVIACLKIPD